MTTAQELLFLNLEDDDIEATLMQRTLEAGWKIPFQLHRCVKVEEVLEFFKLRQPDLILLDLNVLDSGGISTVEKVTRQLPEKSVLIVVTSMKEQALALRALELGAQDYIIKGEYSPDSLATAIRFSMARKRKELYQPSSGDEKLTLSDLTVDLVAQTLNIQVGHDVKELSLTPLELRLAAYFLKNFDTELSREEIKDSVWGKEMVISDRVIDNQVSRVRAKLEATQYKINSIRGFGYRLVADKK